jgi:hypothetical protein
MYQERFIFRQSVVTFDQNSNGGDRDGRDTQH